MVEGMQIFKYAYILEGEKENYSANCLQQVYYVEDRIKRNFLTQLLFLNFLDISISPLDCFLFLVIYAYNPRLTLDFVTY